MICENRGLGLFSKIAMSVLVSALMILWIGLSRPVSFSSHVLFIDFWWSMLNMMRAMSVIVLVRIVLSHFDIWVILRPKVMIDRIEVLMICMADREGNDVEFIPLLIIMLKALLARAVRLIAASVEAYFALGRVDLCGLYMWPRWM